jgi:PTH1 family peptidyl-tRNA hydrolase
LDAASLIQKLFPRGTGGAQNSVEWIVAGLGNPGPQYKGTRHNVGWWSLDDLTSRAGGRFKASGASAEIADIEVDGRRVLLVRPLTYVNRSGDTLRHVMRKHHVIPDRLIVIYDDLNLETGKIRIRQKGGSGGHNGMNSIISALATEEFTRIRIGVGRPADSSEQVDYVLGRMAPREREVVRAAATRAADAAQSTIQDGLDIAMNRFNG